jgi:hypothetical protein
MKRYIFLALAYLVPTFALGSSGIWSCFIRTTMRWASSRGDIIIPFSWLGDLTT